MRYESLASGFRAFKFCPEIHCCFTRTPLLHQGMPPSSWILGLSRPNGIMDSVALSVWKPNAGHPCVLSWFLSLYFSQKRCFLSTPTKSFYHMLIYDMLRSTHKECEMAAVSEIWGWTFWFHWCVTQCFRAIREPSSWRLSDLPQHPGRQRRSLIV